MRRAFAWVMCAVFSAGCVGAGDADPARGEAGASPLAPQEVDPESELGVVQGTLTNEEANPIETASVGLAEPSISTVTGPNGFFQFLDVPPGKYALQAAQLGFEASARSIEVKAGEITSVSMILVPMRVEDAVYPEVFHFGGFFECALAVPGWVSACSFPYTAAHGTAKDNGVNLSQYGAPADLQPNKHRFNITIRKNLGQFVGEMVWQPSSAAATRMRLNMKCGDYHPVWDDCVYPYDVSGGSIRYGESVGTSPLRVVIDQDQFVKLGRNKGKWDLDKNGQIWIMNYCSLPHGSNQVAFQQRFDVWDTVFYNGKAPEGYSILRDA